MDALHVYLLLRSSTNTAALLPLITITAYPFYSTACPFRTAGRRERQRFGVVETHSIREQLEQRKSGWSNGGCRSSL